MSRSNPMHHSGPAPTAAELAQERDTLLQLIGKIHNNAAESPEWIRARIDETLVGIVEARLATAAKATAAKAAPC